MSEKKITVDMNLFKIPDKTRKKRDSEKKDGIKVKAPSEKKRNETLKKRSILKMIRQHQEERYKKLFDEKKGSGAAVTPEADNFNKDFKEAQVYLQTLTEKKNEEKNKTLRNHHTVQPSSLLFHPNTPATEAFDKIPPPLSGGVPISLKPAIQNIGVPKYGCLKGGELPTYRTLMNQTRKQPPIISGGMAPIPTPTSFPVVTDPAKILEEKINESMKRANAIKEETEKLKQLKGGERPKKMKRKKTLRRTYKIGKSKLVPKVSVLVSNKTIRNNISTQSQLLKQTPIEEVKRFLVKRGLIKVGSVTPTDVLRKMYESAVMMCGEVHNHNPENLLYNYVNDK
jgi:hypothetical protein